MSGGIGTKCKYALHSRVTLDLVVGLYSAMALGTRHHLLAQVVLMMHPSECTTTDFVTQGGQLLDAASNWGTIVQIAACP